MILFVAAILAFSDVLPYRLDMVVTFGVVYALVRGW